MCFRHGMMYDAPKQVVFDLGDGHDVEAEEVRDVVEEGRPAAPRRWWTNNLSYGRQRAGQEIQARVEFTKTHM